MKRDEKTVVFVLVEGSSDKIVLTRAFEKSFLDKRVIVMPYGGDITTDKSTDASNIKERIFETMWFRLRQNGLDSDDVSEIIHIIDTDGAYVEDKRIISDDSSIHPFYNATKGVIRTHNKWGIEKRNQQKRENVDALVSCNNLYGVPYRIFFMSCNLEHIINNNPNMSKDLKIKAAKQFATNHGSEPSTLIRFLSQSSFSSTGGYHESWDTIRFDNSGLESIRRATNIGIALKRA